MKKQSQHWLVKSEPEAYAWATFVRERRISHVSAVELRASETEAKRSSADQFDWFLRITSKLTPW